MEKPTQQQADSILNIEALRGMPWQTRDPFLFCVHHNDAYPKGNAQFGPAGDLQGRMIGQDFAGIDGWNMYHGNIVPGFPAHPHRGFETVTVVCRGLLDHADSMGAAARYGQGDVQWLTAGQGIMHAEMFPLLSQHQDNPVELFQIWLNLPKRNKMAEPHFKMLWASDIPSKKVQDAQGKTIVVTAVAGDLEEIKPPVPPPESWASQNKSNVAIWTIKLEQGASWTLPATQKGSNRSLYFFAGSRLEIAGHSVESGTLIDLRPEDDVAMTNLGNAAELLMLQGHPIGEPVVQHGPFVMNTKQEVQQAFFDYQRTQFGGWPWDRNDPVHGPEQKRFARHADGRVETPI